MRTRSIALLSTVAAATLLLAGCSGDSVPESTATPGADGSAAADCILNAPSGDAADAVAVDGEGVDAKITVPEGTDISEVQRAVVVKGEGDDVHAGDLVTLRYQLVDAVTAKVLETSERGPDGVLPALLSSGASQMQNYDLTQEFAFTAAVECLPLGSHVALVIPGSGEQNPSVLYVETIDELPKTADGADAAPVDGMPTVELDADGAPTITIPDADAPAETKVVALKEGDGPVVGSGDLVTVQYRGVKWSDGEEFDSSWSRGAEPSQFPTTGVVTGFKMALEGQKVGSQVLVAMTAADGYGAEPAEGNELAGEPLVFVVDILATNPLIG